MRIVCFILVLTGLLGAGTASVGAPPPSGWTEAVLAAVAQVQAAPATLPAATNAWEALEKQFPLACDWMQQDYQAEAWAWLARPEPSTLRQMLARARRELGDSAAPSSQPAGPGPDELSSLLISYQKACEVRRVRRLQNLAARAPRLVFTKHWNIGGSHYAYTEGQSDAQAERHFFPGSALCVLTSTQGVCQVETWLEDKTGVIRDPEVSGDGQRILFAWKKSNHQDDYHLYEMSVATRQIRQLTDGLGVADYEGVYLPNGDILFNSTRCVQTVDCWWTEVSNLYRCDQDGQRIRRMTVDQVHDNYPTVTEDGRILYTRWEYNDRSQIYPQPLFQMMPDGTGQGAFYGENSWFPTTILHARGIPGTQKVVAIATGHHSRQTGKLILIDPAKGREENTGVQLIAPVRETPAVRVDAYGQQGELFQYPYPLSETEFLVTYHPLGWQSPPPHEFSPRFGVYWMAMDGRRELLAADPTRPCNQAIPLRPRPTPVARPESNHAQMDEATVYVQDVYAGLPMRGISRGKIKTMRVVELAFRAAGIGSNGNGGPGGGALISTPVAIGNGTWDPKSILGQSPIQPDGSVFVRVPARKPIYFQLLDAQGRLVQTMRSWTTLQPGENASCVGCHEHKNSAPPPVPSQTLAFRAGPQALQPFFGPTRGFSFTREIQPILEARCVRCHDGEKTKTYDLRATPQMDQSAKRAWLQSYLVLTHGRPDRPEYLEAAAWRGNPNHPLVNWISAGSVPTPLPPYAAGSNKSKLMDLLDKGHEGVRLTSEESEKLAAWIDLGVPFCGDYLEANTWNAAEKAKYQRYWDKRQRLAQAEDRE